VTRPHRRPRRLGWLALAGLALLAAIQLVPARRSNPAVRSEVEAPPEVRAILRRACYNCHSNETRWPWYSRVAPVSWWVASHVREARGDLNFSEWPAFDLEAQEEAFHDIREEVSEGRMPLRSYLLMHREARLTEADRQILLRWAGSP
jgi:hypothetical protein